MYSMTQETNHIEIQTKERIMVKYAEIKIEKEIVTSSQTWFWGMCWARQVPDISVERSGWATSLATPPTDNICRFCSQFLREESSKLLSRKACSQSKVAERSHGSSVVHCVIVHPTHQFPCCGLTFSPSSLNPVFLFNPFGLP